MICFSQVRTGGAVVLAAVSGVDHDGADPPLRQRDVAHDRLDHIFEIQFRDERTSAEKRRGVEVSHGNAVEGAVPLVECHDDPGVAQGEGETVVFAPRHGHSVKPCDIADGDVTPPCVPLRADRTRNALCRKQERSGGEQKQQKQREQTTYHPAVPFRSPGGNME